MPEGGILLAIVLATFVQFLIGLIWYSPLLFGKSWQKENKITDEEICSKRMPIPEALAVSAIISGVLTKLVVWTHSATFMEGISLGFWCWLGFVATTHFSGVLWAKKPLKAYAIDVTCLLLSISLSGGLIAFLISKVN